MASDRPGQSDPGRRQGATGSPIVQDNPPREQKPTTEQKAHEVTERVAEKAQSTLENARAKVTGQINSLARVMGRATEDLKQDQHEALSRHVQQLAHKADRASQYLRDKNPKEMKDDLERLARDRPAWFLAGAFVAGLIAARFLKSSERHAEHTGAFAEGMRYGTA
jgi:hypothetical protein